MSVAPLVLVVVVLCAVSRSQGQGLTVAIDEVYTSPADFKQPTRNDFRAASGPVTFTCVVAEVTGSLTYKWTSTCNNCFVRGTSQSVTGTFFRVERESGTHTCTATDSDSGRTGSADFVMRIIGIGVFVFEYSGASVPDGGLPNNGIVVALSTRTESLTFGFQCRSGSRTDNSVRQFIGLNGQPRGTSGALRVNSGLSALAVDNQGRSDLSEQEEGVYTCRMRDENEETVEVNVGIYRNGFNTLPSITSLTFDPDSFTLTCTSTGSPATTVTWMKDGSPLVIDGTTYSMEQTVPDAGRPTSTYENVLTIGDSGSSFGTCSCEVSNALGSSGPTAIGAAEAAGRLGAPQVGTDIKVHWIGLSPTTPQSGYRIFFQGGGEQGSVVFATTDVTSHTLSVQNDVTYTIRIQIFSTTKLPSAEVTVQSRRAPVVVHGDEALPGHRIVPNHGIVDRDDIGGGLISEGLHCQTNNLDCCDRNSGGYWHFPNMTEVPLDGTVYYSIVPGPGFGATLFREFGGTEEGIFHCQIPDENGDPYDQYVGVYGPGAGAVTELEGQLTVLTEDPPLFVLNCTSKGGPASTVTWSWNGVPVTEDSNHVILQSVVDGVTAVYNNSLTVSASEFGTYTCTVNNDRTSIALSDDIIVEAPPSPVGLTVTQGTPTTFTVSWSAPSFVPITGYRVTYNITGIAVGTEVKLPVPPSELRWSSPPLDESRTYDITVAVQTLSDSFPSAPANAPIPSTPSGPVTSLEGSPSLSQISVSWDEIAANTVIIRYEVKYTSTDGSSVITDYTGSQPFVIEERNHGTDYNFSVTPFSLLARGQSEERTVQTLSEPPQVGGVGVRVMSATSVLVFWDRSPLPLEELRGYRVDYREVVQARKRLVDGNETDEGFRNFSSEATSGVVDGLRTGVNYQFQVTALAVRLDGTPVEGDASEESDNTMAVPAEQDGGGGGGGGGDDTGAIVGAIVAVLVVVALVVVIVAVVLYLWWRRRSSDEKYVPRVASRPPRPEPPIRYTRGAEKVTNGRDNDQDKTDKLVEPVIQDFPKDAHVMEGESVYYTVKVSGVPPPTITWYHEGKEVVSDYSTELKPDGTLHILSAESRHTGVYQMVAQNSAGSAEREVNVFVRVEGEATPALQKRAMEMKPVPVADFGQYVDENHSNNNRGFRDQYLAIDSGADRAITVGASPKNKPLNRFANIVAYDENRVSLAALAGHSNCQNDYVNASYVDGFTLPKQFLATQGPLPKTLVDFWRLVWQERPPTIVMITNLKEGSKIKCQQYWPETGHKTFGPFQITITGQQTFPDYTIRTLQVSLSGSSGRSLKITQFHFTAWPDHGVPEYATPILAFHKRIKAHHNPSRGPLMVHCSAGVGRTGTYIVIDRILEQIARDNVVDIAGNITSIRTQRMKLVQTVEQYVFVHDAILEYVTCGDTQIAAGDLRRVIGKLAARNPQTQITGYESQYKVLHQVSPKPDEVRVDAALQAPEKNRTMEYLPPDKHRVILKGAYPDYINATFANGYKQPKAFIVSQGPLTSTCSDFWKMIYDRKCAAIVMLSHLREGGEEVSAQYWPTSGVKSYGEYTVDLLGEEKLEGFVLRTLSVLESKSGKAHQVSQFHVLNWQPDGRCNNLKTLTDVIEEVTKVQIRTGNNPIVVHCSDTVSRSGMFCAIATTIERCKTEGVVDVFQVVKALRVQKPGAVATVEQYHVVFDAVLTFLDSMDTYANFQTI